MLCFSLLGMQHCHCLDLESHRTLSTCTYLDRAQGCFHKQSSRPLTALRIGGGGACIPAYLHPSSFPFFPSFLLSLFTFFWSLAVLLTFERSWGDLLLGHWQLSHLRKDQDKDHVKEAKRNLFKHVNWARLHTGSQDALKIRAVKAERKCIRLYAVVLTVGNKIWQVFKGNLFFSQ